MIAYGADTLPRLFQEHPAADPAIGAAGRSPLTYGGLRDLVGRTVADLAGMGVGRGDRVAVVLPNGPEMAAAFAAIACGATIAPLNPAYRGQEFSFYLGEIGAKALVIQEGMASEARAVAAARDIPVVEFAARPDAPAGDFTLLPPKGLKVAPVAPRYAEAEDIALVLHTSGTTGRPRTVPLSHRNITASAVHIRHTLALTRADVCLNIMPLFHVHGLIGAVLSSLAAGGSVNCTPGFSAFKFTAWLKAVRPTWYTAVPTMHQAILAMVARRGDAIERGRLRFIRSSSSPLSPRVMAELEGAFGVPAIDAYGMTEAAHQMTSNPLPPLHRLPGSVGIASGPDVAIMGKDGRLLAVNESGEVVVRGRNVMAGYESSPDANARAFTDGWFRTGDHGHLDEEGYLRLTGRLKELINRGGEKISPFEVDNAIMDHPAVAEVVTFAVPHDKLGEEVAAAVVVREGMTVDEHELRAFAAVRLASFKVPRKILFVSEIPKGATGKLQRTGLAQTLGLTR